MTRLSWTQPQCATCWNERNPDVQIEDFVRGPDEKCAWCGMPTAAGLYVRCDPAKVRYPAVRDD